MTRVFDAPRDRVFESLTEPELLKRWLFGPPGWSHGGRTTLTATVLYASREARDAVLKTPMDQGVAASYDRLAELMRLEARQSPSPSPSAPHRRAGRLAESPD